MVIATSKSANAEVLALTTAKEDAIVILEDVLEPKTGIPPILSTENA